MERQSLARQTNYRIGSLHALMTAALLATQEPFSAVAAKLLDAGAFICFTQLALLMSIPLLILPRGSRRDFFALLSDIRNVGRLTILLIVGLCGLMLYHVGLSSAHPIITAAIFNLSPFWAALVALVLSRKGIPVSPQAFFGCFGVAFVGAMLVAWSQIDKSGALVVSDLTHSLLHSRWAYAIPIPIFYALSGTLVGRWFADYDESAAIAANFLVSAAVLIPSTALLAQLHLFFALDHRQTTAVLLLLLGTLAAAAAGRVFYQVALSDTDNDNGFVTMFFLLVPALSALITAPLSLWIVDLRFVAGPLFFTGMVLITAPLLLFSLLSRKASRPGSGARPGDLG